jgi:hypothetical protein
MTRVVTWSLEAIAIGPKGQQMDVEVGFDTKPTNANVEQAKVDLSRAIWASFPTIFYADPVRVEIHINHDPEEVA